MATTSSFVPDSVHCTAAICPPEGQLIPSTCPSQRPLPQATGHMPSALTEARPHATGPQPSQRPGPGHCQLAPSYLPNTSCSWPQTHFLLLTLSTFAALTSSPPVFLSLWWGAKPGLALSTQTPASTLQSLAQPGHLSFALSLAGKSHILPSLNQTKFGYFINFLAGAKPGLKPAPNQAQNSTSIVSSTWATLSYSKFLSSQSRARLGFLISQQAEQAQIKLFLLNPVQPQAISTNS